MSHTRTARASRTYTQNTPPSAHIPGAPKPLTHRRAPTHFRPGAGLAAATFHHNPRQITLSKPTLVQLEKTIKAGWASSTLKGYSAVVERYIKFCVSERIPEVDQFPAQELALCAFVAKGAGQLAGGTARNWIAALKAWHTAQNAPWLGGTRLQYTVKGVENLRPKSSRKPARVPVTRDMLRCLHKTLNFESSFDSAVYAAACVLFWDLPPTRCLTR
ncbi:hypothetical protein PUNSTDRAFT_139758 [Punctularia strigosozonata HHB-11173 SS5]|uniref:Core-binding (CB) domain-containing protein n=1 Tax=Punctularia strigosozonata (strain HHB-11173) TaxID=741275 RepID=R7S0B9_PUNST|nr:uncharacterized protein PUNSTDRAFT_139758 [Punctularia strigosozonata HHB-11173 SS5]EIN03222.1 hypothetical protein PUNSTDRAFT_139758 [Punctularia strigosozonata HHB-11173 SS5]